MAKINASYVYCILNTQTNRRYVGSTINYSHRKADHIHRLRKGVHYSQAMQNDYDEFGEESFVVFKLEEVLTFDNKELFDREQYWMDKYQPVYNVNPKAGNTFTDYAREKSKEWHIKKGHRVQSQEEKDKRSTSLKKFYKEHPNYLSISEEQKQHLSKINTGKNNPNWGKTRSQETLDKMAKSMSKREWNGLVSPDGIVYNSIMNLSKFAKDHNLCEYTLYGVFRGKPKSHKGWRLIDGVLP